MGRQTKHNISNSIDSILILFLSYHSYQSIFSLLVEMRATLTFS